MPFMAVHISIACLWDTLSSRPADLTVFAESRLLIEYPHSGICFGFSPDCANKLQRRSIYVLRVCYETGKRVSMSLEKFF